MTRPDTCGVAGGAMSMWINVDEDLWGGIIAHDYEKTGSQINVLRDKIWYEKQHNVFTFHILNKDH